MNQEQLQAIRERVDNASVGPWEVDRKDEVLDANGDFVVLAIYRDDHNEMNNAEFIAHAREDVPALLDEIKRLQKLLREHEDGLKGIASRVLGTVRSTTPEERKGAEIRALVREGEST